MIYAIVPALFVAFMALVLLKTRTAALICGGVAFATIMLAVNCVYLFDHLT